MIWLRTRSCRRERAEEGPSPHGGERKIARASTLTCRVYDTGVYTSCLLRVYTVEYLIKKRSSSARQASAPFCLFRCLHLARRSGCSGSACSLAPLLSLASVRPRRFLWPALAPFPCPRLHSVALVLRARLAVVVYFRFFVYAQQQFLTSLLFSGRRPWCVSLWPGGGSVQT